ncbi:MAG TPA: lysylphosphatidylglycerol synthase transmembrane domain-containing protein [Gemmatimonadaceae bacterium]|nr:lysylphosphatidylglycerol synthase transmembrane domain-containing protein [Gemmatimonadaceae bacterium]
MNARWRGALGIALSALLLVWVLHGVTWAEVAAHVRRANVALLVLSAFVATLTFPLRARRWRTILEPIAGRLPFGMLWRATAVGMMANNVLPARTGELIRAYVLTRETDRVRYATAFASIAADRAFDAIVVLVLLVAAVFDPAFPATRLGGVAGAHAMSTWIGFGAALVGGALVALYVLLFFPALLARMVSAIARRIAPSLERRGVDLVHAFAGGLTVLRRPTHAAAVLWWTLLHWLTNALAFWIGFRAVGIDAPLTSALLVQGLIALGIAIPSAPGFWGIFEAAGKVGLAIYGVHESLAVTWAVAYHVVSFIPITLIGIYYVGRLGLRMGELRRMNAAPDAPPGTDAASPADRGASA